MCFFLSALTFRRVLPAEKANHSETLPSTVHKTLLTLHAGKIQAAYRSPEDSFLFPTVCSVIQESCSSVAQVGSKTHTAFTNLSCGDLPRLEPSIQMSKDFFGDLRPLQTADKTTFSCPTA